MVTSIVNIIFGALLLFAGRRLFFISMGIMGFLIGFEIGSVVWPQALDWASMFALACGVVGAVLAAAFQWIAVVILNGFLGGGFLLTEAAPYISSQSLSHPFLFVIGGFIGIVIMIFAYDWALITISTLIGAILIVQSIEIPPDAVIFVFLGLFFLGLSIQSAMFKPSRHP